MVYNTFTATKPKDARDLGSGDERIAEILHYGKAQPDNYAIDVGWFFSPIFGQPRLEAPPSTLRQFANTVWCSAAIKTIIDEITSLEWNIIPKEEYEENYDEKKLNEIKAFFTYPNQNGETLTILLKKLLKDILELDAGVIVKVFSKGSYKKANYSMKTYQYSKDEDIEKGYENIEIKQLKDENIHLNEIYVRDGGSFLVNPDLYGVLPEDTPAYFQYSFYHPTQKPLAFNKREIVYMRMNPRTTSHYGFSPIQSLFSILESLNNAARFNRDYFVENAIPSGILSLMGASKDSINKFKANWDKQIRGKPHKLAMFNQEIKWTPMNLNNKDMEWLEGQKFYQRLVWAMFGVTSDELGFCYSEDTRVLTESGFKHYFELKDEDKIATLNEANNIEYITPSAINTFDVKDRKFHHYKNGVIDIMVSDNHRMHYRTMKNKTWKMSPSNEIDVNTIKLLQGGLGWKGENIEEFEIPLIKYENNKDKKREQQIKFPINEFCEFLGYYLSEGSVLKAMNEKKQYPIKVAQTNLENMKVMKPLLEKMGFRREKICWTLNNKSLAIYLHQFGDCFHKYIPKEIKNLPKDKLKILFDALMLGDGHRCKGGTAIRYHTSSKQLADDVLEVMLKLGYKASIHTTEFKNKSWKVAYTINANSTQFEPRIVLSKQRTEESYTGIMWCPSVENRRFITERNGKIGINYNTETSNRSVGQSQSRVFNRRAIKPYTQLIEAKFNNEIIPEFFPDGKIEFEFKFNVIDQNEQLLHREENWKDIELGIKTVNEVREEIGLEPVEGGDELRKPGQASPFGFPQQPNQAETNKPEEREETEKPKKPKYMSIEEFRKAVNIGLNKKQIKQEVAYDEFLVKYYGKLEDKIIEIFKEEVGNKDFGSFSRRIAKHFTTEGLAEQLFKFMKNLFTKGVQDAEKELNIDIGVTEGDEPLINQYVKEQINGYGFESGQSWPGIKGLNNTAQKEVMDTLREGVGEGESIPDLTKRIQTVFDTTKAHATMIARTESNRIVSDATYKGYIKSGYDGEVHWLAKMDTRTSDACKHLNGKEVKLGQDFEWAGNKKQKAWKGQHPPQHPSCRCTTYFKPKRD